MGCWIVRAFGLDDLFNLRGVEGFVIPSRPQPSSLHRAVLVLGDQAVGAVVGIVDDGLDFAIDELGGVLAVITRIAPCRGRGLRIRCRRHAEPAPRRCSPFRTG